MFAPGTGAPSGPFLFDRPVCRSNARHSPPRARNSASRAPDSTITLLILPCVRSEKMYTKFNVNSPRDAESHQVACYNPATLFIRLDLHLPGGRRASHPCLFPKIPLQSTTAHPPNRSAASGGPLALASPRGRASSLRPQRSPRPLRYLFPDSWVSLR